MDDGEERRIPWPKLEEVRDLRVSYAQNWEDIRLARVFPGPEGTYLDVGAFEPVYHSVTKLFYDRGWRGVNIEPQPLIHARLAAERPGDVNLNVGVADRAGLLSFYETPDWPGLSSFHESVPEQARRRGIEVIERKVPVVTLAEVCEKYVGAGRPVDFLKVDAECLERAVLEGGDWDRWRPRVVVVEASFPDDCGPFLEDRGYEFAAHDLINRFFVRVEDRDMIPALAAPPSVLDRAVSFNLLRLIEEKADLGPNVVALARGLRRLAARHPRLAALATRLVRAAV